MDKKGFLKACVIAITTVFIAGIVMAQTLISQIKLTNGLSVPLDAAGNIISANDIALTGALPEVATVLVDNFEYWDNPRNMGWDLVEPPYPVWGSSYGSGHVNNVFDCALASRVLDTYNPFCFWCFYGVLQISKKCAIATNDENNPTRSIPGENSLISFEVRSPMHIEQFYQFSLIVEVTATSSDGIADQDVAIVFRPVEGPMGATGLYNRLNGADAIDEDECAKSTILVALGKMFQDGNWHQVKENLADIIAAFDNGDPDDDSDDAVLQSIEEIIITGNTYRLDNIMFTQPSESLTENNAPHLFHVGPVYCQLYGQQGNDPHGRWLYAEDLDLGLTSERTADGGLFFPHLADDADGDGIPTALHINPDGTIENQADITESTLAIYHLDRNGKPNLASLQTPADADLTWTITAGDTFGSVITPPYIAEEVGINLDGDDTISGDEMNTWPPYIIQRNGVFIKNKLETDPDVVQATGTPYVMDLTNPLYALARALLNSGYKIFPNALKIVPQFGPFEDAIFTCRVSDGIDTDKETFPLSVVNYPVTNNPPIFDDVDDQTFEVGKTNYYQIIAYDPDLEDMLGGLTYSISVYGESDYQFGPWWDNVIKIDSTGLISFKPLCEDTIDCIVKVTDPRGISAVCEFTICCQYPGWFNHPPVILGELDSPQSIRAGEMFIASEMDFFDPDGDKMYWSCNVGSVGNNGVYTFQSMFPGYYQVQITAYDIRGSATSTEFVINVKPWWSM